MRKTKKRRRTNRFTLHVSYDLEKYPIIRAISDKYCIFVIWDNEKNAPVKMKREMYTREAALIRMAELEVAVQ